MRKWKEMTDREKNNVAGNAAAAVSGGVAIFLSWWFGWANVKPALPATDKMARMTVRYTTNMAVNNSKDALAKAVPELTQQYPGATNFDIYSWATSDGATYTWNVYFDYPTGA